MTAASESLFSLLAASGTSHHWLYLVVLLFALGLLPLALRRARPLVRRLQRALPPWLPLHRAVLLASLAVAVATFAGIADEVREHATTHFDRTVELAVHSWDNPALDLLFRAFTFIGSVEVVLPALVLVAWLAWRRGHPRISAMLVGIALVTEAANLILKNLYQRARPDLFHEVATLYSYSFPSGHSMGAAGIWGAIGIALARLFPRYRGWFYALTPLLVLGIGLSRVYLGVHWPTDVLAGFAGGASVLLVGVELSRAPRQPA